MQPFGSTPAWGQGLLESVYEALPVIYQGTRIEAGFRADLIVEDQVIVEIKSVEAVAPLHKKQLLTHLWLADKRLGLLINFNVTLIKDGITRIANRMPE
jgi:GxxExxY protein